MQTPFPGRLWLQQRLGREAAAGLARDVPWTINQVSVFPGFFAHTFLQSTSTTKHFSTFSSEISFHQLLECLFLRCMRYCKFSLCYRKWSDCGSCLRQVPCLLINSQLGGVDQVAQNGLETKSTRHRSVTWASSKARLKDLLLMMRAWPGK